jgi:hypothetical protein
MHVAQVYPPGHPNWLVESFADYVRAKYGTNNESVGWAISNYS